MKEEALLIQHSGVDVLEAITARASIRRYTPQPVGEDQLHTLLNAGFCAPSADNVRPWQFIAVRERAQLRRLAQAGPYTYMLDEAPLALAVCGDTRYQPEETLLLEDCAAATQNILLAVHGLGLGAVWCGITPHSPMMDNCRRLLALPAWLRPIALLSIGHPAEQRARPPRYEADKVHYEQWSG